MDMYSGLLYKVNLLEWKSHYGKETAIAELLTITETLGIKANNPKDEFEFAKTKGKCGKKIMEETGKIELKVSTLIKSISKETFTFGEEKESEKSVFDGIKEL